MNQGFHIVYGKNGIVNLLRQRHGSQTKTGKFRIDQCILFCPVRTDNTSYNRNRKRQKRFFFVFIYEYKLNMFYFLIVFNKKVYFYS